MDRWFLLDDCPASGALNMATDEFLLERAQSKGGGPVLRIYRFQPPAVTIGYHQNPEKILDLEALKRDRRDLVRRITGGRALLHDGELTYCITACRDSWLFGSGLNDTFIKVSRALTAALRSIGVDARISNGSPCSGDKGLASPCLASVSRYEITARGRKIVGSAQRRTRNAFLQHGSILLEPASQRIVEYLKGSCDSLGGRVTSVSEEISRETDGRELRSALVAAFSKLFSAACRPFKLTREDLEEIGRRALDKSREFSALLGTETVSAVCGTGSERTARFTVQGKEVAR